MKINLKSNIKIPKIKGLLGTISAEKSMWQKGFLAVAVITVIIFSISCAYLLIRPINEDLKKIVEEEISSTNINFDKNTLDNLEKRRAPEKITAPSTGKNPFMPF